MEQVSNLITQKLEVMASDLDTDSTSWSKRKAISALFPYAIRLARGGQQEMLDAICRVASKSTRGGFMWHCIGLYATTLFDESSPPCLNQAIALASPLVDWDDGSYTEDAVARWAAAALATPYSEEVGRSVINALLQIASVDFLQSHIPIDIWVWLNRRPSLPPVCRGRSRASSSGACSHIRGLGDIEILKSFFLLVWSEWSFLEFAGLAEMELTIREDFGGVGMWHHREPLVERLDYILGQLDRGLEYFKHHKPTLREGTIRLMKEQYAELKEVLLEI